MGRDDDRPASITQADWDRHRGEVMRLSGIVGRIEGLLLPELAKKLDATCRNLSLHAVAMKNAGLRVSREPEAPGYIVTSEFPPPPLTPAPKLSWHEGIRRKRVSVPAAVTWSAVAMGGLELARFIAERLVH